MGTVNADSSAAVATGNIKAIPFVSGPHVVGVAALPTDPATIKLSGTSSRIKQTPRPLVHVTLVAAQVTRSSLVAANATKRKKAKGMDAVPEITVTQFQRVTLLAFVVDQAGVAITRADVLRVSGSLFRPSVEGGTPLITVFPTVASSIYDTTQTALDPDGYNVQVQFEMATEGTSSGGSSYLMEVVVELTTGEPITVRGRAFVEPVLSLPANAY